MFKESTLEKDKLIDETLRQFEIEEREKLDLLPNLSTNWKRPEEEKFYTAQRGFTTILLGGLTKAHDYLVQGGFEGLGYTVQCLECPDNEALRYGKEMGNRGQCNPTYFTVGNLVKHLIQLRDDKGFSVEDIVKNYIFLTAGACGPCRFGMYEAEYRKALTDAGFPGFRVITFEQKVDVQAVKDLGLEMNFKFYKTLIKTFIAADLVNALGYRIRPYEVNKGETDRVLEECKDILYKSFSQNKWLSIALWKIRKKIAKIEVNYLQPKPVVDIIGEFWAMTTEGDGNYHMQSWLEKEGAEVHVQQVVFWLMYTIWEVEKWYTDRIHLKKHDEKGLKGENPKKALRLIRLSRVLLKAFYGTYARLAGLKGVKLPDMTEIEAYAKEYYNTSLSGGEGHMEVGKLIAAAKKKKSHMVLSIKPFGCMPSAGVSDGVQSRIQELYPDIIFYPIETSGDGAINVYSRVQMMLYKAKLKAKEEFEALLTEHNVTTDDLNSKTAAKKVQKALHRSPHRATSTASNVALELV